MSSLRDQQKEVVRLLYIQHGSHKIASELSGVPYDVVRQWAVRGKWTKQDVSQAVTRSPLAVVTDALQSEIAENESQTRISLSRYARKASKDSEKASLKDSPYVHKAAQVAGIAFKWDAKEREQPNVIVNIALLGIQPSEVRATATEAESGVSE